MVDCKHELSQRVERFYSRFFLAGIEEEIKIEEGGGGISFRLTGLKFPASEECQ